MSEDALNYLLSRRSAKFVQAPGPNDNELARMLQTAMSAPDHGKLRPWRFTLIRGDAIPRLADMAISGIKAAGLPLAPEKEANTRSWLAKVPLLIAVACKLDHSNTKIPEHERMLATGAAVSNILNAAHMMGYAAFWSTGLGTYVDEVAGGLGFDSLDYRFMGYIAVGTPISAVQDQPRPDYREFVSEWQGA
ncbi:nitroreductase family protein [Pollutimonas harenae]|uniref:Putative NAD(P)H nitroreductase n=1 Tax=Pollutimonas harenae TaxID=657015 RepID=A0A853H7P1_9BURK|nr:nitroreductase [Pollutimonas harenae]NYT86094.1 nitroreductase [Pollutimonas harenae]TEA71139.1 nitroreductase [Pollutimonas harenae]